MTPRYKAFFFARQREEYDTPWIRIEDLPDLELPRPVVLVTGAFDLLASGHMRLLFAAREKAKTLVVGLEGDELIREQKGVGRPILSWLERAAQMNYMPIDYLVEIAIKEDRESLIRALRPDLRVFGQDQRAVKTRWHTPRMFVRDGAIHTSDIIQRIKGRLIDGRLS